MSTQPKPFVFALMPFDMAYDDVYKFGIKAACAEAGGYCERVDEQIFEESILERIYNQISKADLLIADMSERNPNVFYEVGYAHALGKRVILLTRDPADIPFDLKHHPHIVYGGRITDLKEELLRRVSWAFANPQEPSQSQSISYSFGINGEALHRDLIIDLPSAKNKINSLTFQVTVHRPVDGSLDASHLRMGIIAPHRFFGATINAGHLASKPFRMEDGRYLHLITKPFELIPGSYDSVLFHLYGSKIHLADGEVTPLILRCISAGEVVELPFGIRSTRRLPLRR